MSKEQKLPPDIIRIRRSGARLAAVQAVYQLEITERGAKAVIREFMEDRLGLDDDGHPVEDADPDLFKQIVQGVVDKQSLIDDAIKARLSEKWRLDRIDSTSRAILRCATQELATRADLSNAVIIEEYVGIAHAFFDGDEPKFVNGLLDKVARDVRPDGVPIGYLES
ncbi:transcription antitermination factor NusB [Ponticaulis sp.]|uniref:transcription antitermination factor NusB n=1 Tax=Ponticaulis sp. TaxID=2020902 RepID=UPI000C3D0B29|nr:transcription antitermination factor NusB [Ponticaulis sp.]MAJ08133.1 transcription antitermination factor NusB [Ponticaulis sp.]MDF1681373.1 transcription antitermination factor NusB [Ponticaulis sp.]HBH90821.1 transcription antitermination factor NusB [Hyphomonadaceae bacterium]HBJ94755.1 transcription antitermination factor NusB [Hyphomonadaceae bacterium]|tara:strand:+ start:73231 stop:73731 length:501 start_codon:yes stop_codon:yes gene_type:complete